MKKTCWESSWGTVCWINDPKEYVERQVDELIAKGADVNVKDENGFTVLMWAAHEGKAVASLIKAGANLDEKDNNGWTALMMAVENGHIEAVKELIEAGANTYVRNKFSHTASVIAHHHGHNKIINMIKTLQQKSNNKC